MASDIKVSSMREKKEKEIEHALVCQAFGGHGVSMHLLKKLIPVKTKGEFAKFFGIRLDEVGFYTEEMIEFFKSIYPDIQWDDDTKDVWIQAGIGSIRGVKFLSLFKNEMKRSTPENPPHFGLLEILTTILNRTKVLPIATLYKQISGKCVCSQRTLLPHIGEVNNLRIH